jgi:DNA-binding NarL/FixJ family response regulator
MPIRVAIADDHPVARQGLRDYLQGEGDMEVVAEVDSGAALLEILGEIRVCPDVALVDARMPSLDGIEATRRIHERFADVKVIVISAFDDEDLVLRAMTAGAHAYLLKSKDGAHITGVIRLVAEGDVVIDQGVAAPILGGLSDRPMARRPADELTQPEIEVLGLLSHGRSNKEIAHALNVSPEAVKGRLTRLFRKLDAADRASAVAEAFRRKAID